MAPAGARRQALRRSRVDVNPVFDVIKQSYLITSELAERAGGRRRRRRADDQAPGRVLHQDAHRRDLAVELPALQSRRAARGDGDATARASSKAWRTSPPIFARRRPALDQPDRLLAVQGRRERRHRARQGDLPERADPDPAVRADDQDGLRDPAADLPAVDQQVLHPRPASGEFDDPLADEPGDHRVRHLLGQPRRHARRPGPSRTTSRRASTPRPTR